MGDNTNDIFSQLIDYSSSAVTNKKMRPSDRLIEDIRAYGFNMSQLETVLRTEGNQLILSCAGSGKTTSLVFKVIFDLKSGRATKLVEVNGHSVRIPETIWVATFLKTGAEELGTSYRKWVYKLHCADMSQSIQFSTLHAEFKRALAELGVSTPIISDSDNTKLLKDIVDKLALRNANGMRLTSEDLSNLSGALTYTRNRLDAKRYLQPIYIEMNITSKIIDSILFQWKAARSEKGMYDFEDLQEALYHECYVKKNQEVIDFLSRRFSYIYVDEFQDTSQIQYDLLKIYGLGAKQVVAIGDDDQTIYSWRGSDNGIITKEFMIDFAPTKTDLSVNFRCPENILKAVVPSIERNKSRFQKDLKSYSKGGIIQKGAYSGYRQMALSLGDMVYEDVQQGMSVAILCRVNSDGLLPAMFFDKLDKFSFSISGQGMTLDSYIGRTAISIIKLFTERATANVRRALNLLTWDSYNINALMNACKGNKLSIWTIDEKDLVYSCPDIAERLLTWRSWKDAGGEIYALRLVLQDYRTNVFTRETQFNDVMRSVLMSIESFLDYYDYESVDEFLLDIEDINMHLKAREKKFKVQVSISTVHEFKGKEADSVYIWNDSENVFPYYLSKNTVEEIEEERRVHYIACTRAKKKSTVMWLKSRKGEFVDEMDLSDAVELSGETSGVIKKAISGRMETSAGLRKFQESASVDTGDFSDSEDDTDGFDGFNLEE